MLPNNMDSGTWERLRVAGGMSSSSQVRRLNDIHFLTSPRYYSLVLGNSTGVWASVFVSVKSRRCKPPTYTLLGVVLRIKWGNRHSKVGNSEALCKYHRGVWARNDYRKGWRGRRKVFDLEARESNCFWTVRCFLSVLTQLEIWASHQET